MEILEKISYILELYDKLEFEIQQLDALCEKIPEEQSEVDKLLSDYYHIIENEEPNDNSMINLCKKIKDARKTRREYDLKTTLISTYKRHKEKIRLQPKNTRIMFKNAIEQAAKDFPTKYNFRVLSDEEVKELLLEKDETNDLIEDIKENKLSKKEIAKKHKVSLPLVYYYANKIKEV